MKDNLASVMQLSKAINIEYLKAYGEILVLSVAILDVLKRPIKENKARLERLLKECSAKGTETQAKEDGEERRRKVDEFDRDDFSPEFVKFSGESGRLKSEVIKKQTADTLSEEEIWLTEQFEDMTIQLLNKNREKWKEFFAIPEMKDIKISSSDLGFSGGTPDKAKCRYAFQQAAKRIIDMHKKSQQFSQLTSYHKAALCFHPDRYATTDETYKSTLTAFFNKINDMKPSDYEPTYREFEKRNNNELTDDEYTPLNSSEYTDSEYIDSKKNKKQAPSLRGFSMKTNDINPEDENQIYREFDKRDSLTIAKYDAQDRSEYTGGNGNKKQTSPKYDAPDRSEYTDGNGNKKQTSPKKTSVNGTSIQEKNSQRKDVQKISKTKNDNDNRRNLIDNEGYVERGGHIGTINELSRTAPVSARRDGGKEKARSTGAELTRSYSPIRNRAVDE
jgi:hypothetical protein